MHVLAAGIAPGPQEPAGRADLNEDELLIHPGEKIPVTKCHAVRPNVARFGARSRAARIAGWILAAILELAVATGGRAGLGDLVLGWRRIGGLAGLRPPPLWPFAQELVGGVLEGAQACPGEALDKRFVDIGQAGVGEVVAQVVQVGPGAVGADGLAGGMGVLMPLV